MTTPAPRCLRCDAPLPAGARFCLACGAPTPTEARGEGLERALADRYALGRELGRGGMATVFLADDLKHKRPVAVKVLHPELAAALGTERFLREIEIAARLTHPHILPVHDSGEAGGLLYYVMPYVEGESLRARLDREGELPVRDAIQLLREIADALAYAHGKGVVHRDVKPDNVLLAGRHALVMDFGVAKAVSAATARITLTTAGVSLGTPAYMAPEQAVADPNIDHRADLYALGVVAYEVLTGRRPIEGSTPQATLAAHVTEEPRPVSELRPSLSPHLAQVVMKCLRKKPADRWQSAEELMHQLEALATPSLGTTPVTAVPPAARAPAPLRRPVVAGALAAALGMAILGWVVLHGRPDRRPPVTASFRQITFSGEVAVAALSPDGRYIVYVEGRDTSDLYVRALAGGQPLRLASGAGIEMVSWMPDSREVLYGRPHDRPGTYAVPLLGGQPRRIGPQYFPRPTPDGLRQLGWSFPWKWFLVRDPRSGVLDTVPVAGDYTWLRDVGWSPDGRAAVVLTQNDEPPSSTISIVSVASGAQERVVHDSVELLDPVWTGDALYYLHTAGATYELWKVQISGGKPRGAPTPVLSGLELAPSLEIGGRSFTISSDGQSLVFVRPKVSANLSWFRFDPERGAYVLEQDLTSGTSLKGWPALSPDGRWIAYSDGDAAERNVFKMPAGGGPPEQLTFLEGIEENPVWSPDGRTLAFGTQGPGGTGLWSVSAGGGAPQRYRPARLSPTLGLAWSPGEQLLYHRPGNRNWYLLDLGTRTERPLVTNDSVGWMFAPRYSPNADAVAVDWNRLPRRGVWLISLTDSSQTLLLEGWAHPVAWVGRDSVLIHDEIGGSLLVVPRTGGPGRPWPRGRPAGCEEVEYSADLGRILCQRVKRESDVWLVQGFDPTVTPRR